MKENLGKVITDILTAFYQPFWFALLLAAVFMFAYKYNSNLKQALKQWSILSIPVHTETWKTVLTIRQALSWIVCTMTGLCLICLLKLLEYHGTIIHENTLIGGDSFESRKTCWNYRFGFLYRSAGQSA